MPHTRSLLRVARRLTLDASCAEDLVQDTLLLAWRAFHQFRAGTNARAWLFRILVNEFRSRLRKGRAAPVMVRLKAESQAPTYEFADAVEIREAVDNLTLEHRTVLLLAVVEGFTCQEVAEIVTAPIGTVMSRLSRARSALRNQLFPAAPQCTQAKGEAL